MHFAYVALLVAATGFVTCTGFFVILLLAGFRFRQRKVPQILTETLPPVTLLKPLCGLEPNLEQNLRSFFDQEYGTFEIIFGTRNAEDPALQVVERVRREFPSVPVKLVFSGEPRRANAKVCSLKKMYAAARYDYLIISDSDVAVKPSYLREVVPPLMRPENGMVTCLYRGVASGGFWSRLEAMGMSVEMTAGVLAADLLEGMKFALGPTMAIRRDTLEAIGGFGPLADYCSDDYILGEKAYQHGYKVLLSTHIIEHIVVNRSLRSSLLHQVRWMKSTRFSRPLGHIATVLSFAMPFGLLGLAACAALGRPWLGVAFLAGAWMNRILMALIAGWSVTRDRESLRGCWLYPLRDLMGFGFWLFSFFGSTILWRGERYRLEPGGLMIPLVGLPAEVSESVVFAERFLPADN